MGDKQSHHADHFEKMNTTPYPRQDGAERTEPYMYQFNYPAVKKIDSVKTEYLHDVERPNSCSVGKTDVYSSEIKKGGKTGEDR